MASFLSGWSGAAGSGVVHTAPTPTASPAPVKDPVLIPDFTIKHYDRVVRNYPPPKDDNPKDDDKKQRPLQMPRHMKHLLLGNRRGKGGKSQMQEIKIDLFYEWNVTTTVATNYTTVQAVSPSLSGEFASCAALYDEMICTGGQLDWHYGTNTPHTAPVAATWVIAYDPLESAALASVTNGYQHRCHQAIGMAVNNVYTTVFLHQPTPSRDGKHHFKFNIQKDTARNQAGAVIFSGQWSDTAGPSVDYGYIKPFFTSLGATGVMTVNLVLRMHCKFRSRS